MARAQSRTRINRRKFLAVVAIAGGAATTPLPLEPVEAKAPAAEPAAPVERRPSAVRPSAAVAAAETETPTAPAGTEGGMPGSDFMVDVIKSLNIDYLPCNPASSFRALHES